MKLRTSKLCVNCESIYEGPGPCPDCASEVFFWVYQALGTALTPKGVLMGDGPRMRGRMTSAELPEFSELGGIYQDLSLYPAGHKRSLPHMLERLGHGISRVLSLSTEDTSKAKPAYERRNPLEFGT